MQFTNLTPNGAASVLLTYSGVGAMFGNLIAVALGKPAEERAEWTAIGGAVGCLLGFLMMACSLVTVTRL